MVDFGGGICGDRRASEMGVGLRVFGGWGVPRDWSVAAVEFMLSFLHSHDQCVVVVRWILLTCKAYCRDTEYRRLVE